MRHMGYEEEGWKPRELENLEAKDLPLGRELMMMISQTAVHAGKKLNAQSHWPIANSAKEIFFIRQGPAQGKNLVKQM